MIEAARVVIALNSGRSSSNDTSEVKDMPTNAMMFMLTWIWRRTETMRFEGLGCFSGSSQFPAASTHLYMSERYCSHASRIAGVEDLRFANGTSPDYPS